MNPQDENNFKNFFNFANNFFFVLDLEYNIIEINQAVTKLLGYSKDDLYGKSVLTVHPPEYREEAKIIIEKMLKGECKSCPLPLLTKYNKYIPVETIVYESMWHSQKAIIGISRNLSEAKLSEEKFQSIFNHSRALMAINTLDNGVYLNVNKTFLETLGYAESEVIGKTSRELDIFHDYDQHMAAMKKFFDDGILDDFELVIKSKTGELITCLFSADKIKIHTHEYVFTSAININEIKKAESKLKYYLNQQILLANISQKLNLAGNMRENIEEVLKLIGEQTGVSRVCIFENIMDGKAVRNTFEWCNAGIEPRMFQLHYIPYETMPSFKKIIKENGRIFSTDIYELPSDLIAILEPQGVKSILACPLMVQNNFFGFICFYECLIKREWPIEETELLRTASNIISDAFERNSITDLLRESELRLKLAIESSNEGLWDWNVVTGSVYFNEEWCKMLGYEQNEIEPNIKSWEKLVHPEDMPNVMKTLKKHLNGETDCYETTHRMKIKDGGWKWILDHGKVVERGPNNEPLRAVGTHIDVSRQKEMEKQLQETIATRDKLFSIIAHDLRGPIASFLQLLEFVTGDGKNNEDMKANLLTEMKTMSERTYHLLENLLNWAKCQQNNIKFMPSIFSINGVIIENIQLSTTIATQKNISLSLALDEEFFVFADHDMINFVIRNLLSNAIKFTSKGGDISVSALKKDKYIEVAVADNGVGIKKDIFENLFNPNIFNTTFGTNKEKGSGLGLILCKDFIERNGGKISAETVIGKGSVFNFTIPHCGN